MCESPYMPLPVDGTEPGDDLYGDADGDGTDDLGKEVYIGRLSYHNRSGLAPQVARILAYEDHPSGLQSYGTAALVAHRGPPPDTRFTVNQEQVRTATYAGVTPSFETIYGSTPGVGNADITDAFGRVGIISYQGHGGESLWSGWNNALLPDNSYRSSDVDALMNAPVTPVVWSYACQTGDLRSTECLIERMMARGTNGAVSAYGATLEEYIAGSVVSNLAIFRAVFGMGITKQALAIRYAERECTKADRAFNAWMFLLLGDPSMQIRRHDVTDPRTAPWRVESPAMIPASCVGCLYTPRVLTTSGMPAAGVQVSLWKPAPSGPASPATAGPRAPSSAQAADDEVLTNLYTGQDGRATFQLPAMTPGPLYLTVNDDDANVAEDSTLVADPSASEYAEAPLPLRLRVVPSVTGAGARMEFGRGLDRDAIVRLVDVGGRTVGRWRVKRGESALSWDGRDDGGRPLASGVYFARLEESASVLTSKVVVVH
jgi:hypothetical protein